MEQRVASVLFYGVMLLVTVTCGVELFRLSQGADSAWAGAYGSWFGGAGSFAAAIAAVGVALFQDQRTKRLRSEDDYRRGQIAAMRLTVWLLNIEVKNREIRRRFGGVGGLLLNIRGPIIMDADLTVDKPEISEELMQELRFLSSAQEIIFVDQLVSTYNDKVRYELERRAAGGAPNQGVLAETVRHNLVSAEAPLSVIRREFERVVPGFERIDRRAPVRGGEAG